MLYTLITLYCTLLTLPLVNASGRSFTVVPTSQEPLLLTLNLTQFIQCANTTRDQVTVWKSGCGDYLLMPNNQTTNYDEDVWLDCVDQQDVGDLVAISDGTYTEDLTNVDQESGDFLSWRGFHYVAADYSSHSNSHSHSSKNYAVVLFVMFLIFQIITKLKILYMRNHGHIVQSLEWNYKAINENIIGYKLNLYEIYHISRPQY
ncbi:putative membrane protein [Wickerhamomyces ciferrii]|uniref:Membrane protein n=1 Tax=Wickerhamomyces ciferrii (strain ATCC 14091 / BCRC 22168 / CBS 111 / JCM 3599 / NBRC 0793 / NRRL Y-1031 F-60-10) TaxID=1206466 RepID=K0KIF2_WICCF|nr:uncharacterized protein BN7_2300 [Wickerhamomyces ciferrii]CCH42756.1 putative membrane protein [Wickerhamomyces ciferrii]